MSRTNFCFVQPPSSLLLEDRVMVPLSVCYMGAWLQQHGHDASVVDLAGIQGDDWKDHMKKEMKKLEEADIIGYTCTTPQYPFAQKATQYLRDEMGFDTPMVCGGIHPTSLSHAKEMDFLDKDGFDSYCIGEGYNAITKMAEDLSGASHRLSRVYAEPILQDVNDLPFAARNLVDLRSYKYRLGDTPATSMYTQYGCPYACQYCESPMAGAWTVRAMNPERIQDEVRYVRDTWGVHGFMFFRRRNEFESAAHVGYM